MGVTVNPRIAALLEVLLLTLASVGVTLLAGALLGYIAGVGAGLLVVAAIGFVLLIAYEKGAS